MLSEFFLAIADGLKMEYEKIGVTVDYASAEGNFGNMLTLMENYVTMGAVQIIITPDTVDTFGDISERVEAQGVQVLMGGVAPDENFEITGINNLDHYALGERCAELALTWVDQAYPDAGEDEVHVCLLPGIGDGALLERQKAIKDLL